MPTSNIGGVSNQLVDPDFIAEPGTPVEKAMDEGLPNVNGTTDPGPDDQERDQPTQEPAKQQAFTPKKSTPAKKK